MINTPERRTYLEQTTPLVRSIATPHPVAVWLTVAVVIAATGIPAAAVSAWWVALPFVAVGLLALLPLRWNLKHRDEALRVRKLRTDAVNAGLRAHPVRAVVTAALIVSVYVPLRLGLRHQASGWWLLLWAVVAAAVATAIGVWKVRRVRRNRPA